MVTPIADAVAGGDVRTAMLAIATNLAAQVDTATDGESRIATTALLLRTLRLISALDRDRERAIRLARPAEDPKVPTEVEEFLSAYASQR